MDPPALLCARRLGPFPGRFFYFSPKYPRAPRQIFAAGPCAEPQIIVYSSSALRLRPASRQIGRSTGRRTWAQRHIACSTATSPARLSMRAFLFGAFRRLLSLERSVLPSIGRIYRPSARPDDPHLSIRGGCPRWVGCRTSNNRQSHWALSHWTNPVGDGGVRRGRWKCPSTVRRW